MQAPTSLHRTHRQRVYRILRCKLCATQRQHLMALLRYCILSAYNHTPAAECESRDSSRVSPRVRACGAVSIPWSSRRAPHHDPACPAVPSDEGCMSTGCSRHACTLVAACPPRHYVARGHSMSVSSVLMGQQDAIIMLLQVGSSRVGFYPTNIFFVWQAPSDWCPRHVCRHSHRALPKVEPRKRCCMRGWSNGARVARAASMRVAAREQAAAYRGHWGTTP